MKVLLALFVSVSAWAQTPTLEDLQRQIDELKAQSAKSSSVTEKLPIKFFGDLRLRFQNEKAEGSDERQRQRLQFRFGTKVDFSEQLQVVARLTSGSNSNSGNVTLGDSASAGSARKTIGIDWAYFNYQPIKQLQLQGGKLPPPFYFVGKNQLILDRDISAEGWAVKVPYTLSDDLTITAAGLSSWVRENYSGSKDITDTMLTAGQGFVTWKPGDTTVIAGGGNFSFSKVKGQTPASLTGAGQSDQGNTLTGGAFAYNYSLNEIFAEVKHKFGDWEVGVFHESIENTSAPTKNKATSTGLGVQYKAWSLSVADQKIEKDAVFAQYTDSDYANNTSDSKGTVAQLGYKINSNASVNITQFTNKQAISGADTKYDRTHFDFMLSF